MRTEERESVTWIRERRPAISAITEFGSAIPACVRKIRINSCGRMWLPLDEDHKLFENLSVQCNKAGQT